MSKAITTYAQSITVDGILVRIIIDEYENGSTVAVWSVAGEKYLHMGNKRYTDEVELIAFITKKCKLTSIQW